MDLGTDFICWRDEDVVLWSSHGEAYGTEMFLDISFLSSKSHNLCSTSGWWRKTGRQRHSTDTFCRGIGMSSSFQGRKE